MSEVKIERRGDRAIVRKQGSGPYEVGIMIEVDRLQATAAVWQVRYNHRTVEGAGDTTPEWEVELPADDWLLIASLIADVMRGGDLGLDPGVAESDGGESQSVPDAISAKSRPER